ncbi:hypothetical protein R3P38DRAFT_2412398, partial [Favolaschia claudopus]
IEKWLERACSVPLSIHAVDTARVTLPIISALVPHSGRFERLTLVVKDPSVLGGFNSLPLLHTLCLQFTGYSDIPDIFQDVSLLRTVVLNGCAYNTHKVRLPWSQLTSLTLRFVETDALVPILRQASTCLVYCSLNLWRTWTDAEHEDDTDIVFAVLLPAARFFCKGSQDFSAPMPTY